MEWLYGAWALVALVVIWAFRRPGFKNSRERLKIYQLPPAAEDSKPRRPREKASKHG